MQKKTLAFLYTSCMFLILVILVIGVTMVNNYDRMTSMEHALHQISESLENEEEPKEVLTDDSIKAAMEEENRVAAAETEGAETREEQKETDAAEPENVGEEQPEEEQQNEPEEQPEPEEMQEAVSQEVKEPERYRVEKGDTLLEISRLRYGTDDMVGKICEINGLEDGDKIYVGETILLP